MLRTSFFNCSIAHSRGCVAPLTPSNTFFSNIHTLTSLFVVLCVAPTTRHNPTLNPFEVEPAKEGRFVDEDEGEAEGVEEWKVYADSEDDLPNSPEAAASIMTGSVR